MGAPDIGRGSRLRSSSKFLNHPQMRDWCGKEMLRRNGADQPPPAGVYEVSQTLVELRDMDRLEALITAERARFPAFDAWFRRGKEINLSREKLARCPAGSLGALLLQHVVENNFELEVMRRPEPQTQWARYLRHRSRGHDLEHLMVGGGFDYMGELVVYYFEMTQGARFFTPELDGEISQMYIFGALRYTVRTVLHYPAAWSTAFACMARGTRVGLASDCAVFVDYEELLPLSLAEARAEVGIREVEEIDTREAAWLWGADSHQALVAAGAARATAAAE
jgi:ubiquinone biosynthesis protein COQ4